MRFFRRKRHEPEPRPATDPEPDADGLAARFLAEAERAVPELMLVVEADAERVAQEIDREAAWIMADSPRDDGAPRSARTEAAAPAPNPGARSAGTPGPSWMSTEEWADRLMAYRRQGRVDAEIAR